MRNINLTYLAGGPIDKAIVLEPYSDIACDFLSELAKRLQKNPKSRMYPDVLSFAFFCRKGNIQKLKEEYQDGKQRLGRGIAFHIAPSNVPVNAAFTYAFGLLAGNTNIVRVSTKDFVQVRIICDVMQEIFEEEAFQMIKNMTAIVLYERNQEINDRLSEIADARIIWGGDTTIRELRKSAISSRCVEMTFADRYSFAVMDPIAMLQASEEEMDRVANAFYNDTYLMDQNACSTPHLILWKKDSSMSKADIEAGKERFWKSVFKNAAKYDLADIKVSDKYVMLCEYAIGLENFGRVDKFENLLYVISLSSLPDSITELRGKFGLFFQYDLDSMEEVAPLVSKKVQTCIYYGCNPDEIREFIVRKQVLGIDRIVPVGSSLDINPIWDGYDVIKMLSRIVSYT